MPNPVIAIGLDAAEPSLIEAWMDSGLLKNIASIRRKGGYARLQNQDYYRAETPWTTFLTGVVPEQTGYWGPVKYQADDYSVKDVKAYDFEEYKPFYLLDSECRISIFDVPQTCLGDHANGKQVLGWGAHSAQVDSQSMPESLLDELIEQYGKHPAFGQDNARIYDTQDVGRLYEQVKIGTQKRSEICQHLLTSENVDFFLTIFGEAHTAGHYFWHLNDADHPMYSCHNKDVGDYLLQSFQEIDQAIGEIVDAAPQNASIIIFSVHGMQANNMDVPSTFFLPELLYRWNFPGKQGFKFEKKEAPLDQSSTGFNNQKWYKNVWTRRSSLKGISQKLAATLPTPFQRGISLVSEKLGLKQNDELISPYTYKNQHGDFDWQPSVWYSPMWKEMKAFALPSFSEGYIRINLKGRDPSGVVEPEAYEATCQEIEAFLSKAKNARNGLPIVDKIYRFRSSDNMSDPRLPDADIVVTWNKDAVVDCIESPEYGRVGPVPFQRSGSHTSNGFLIAKTNEIKPNSNLSDCDAIDLAPSILDLLGISIPQYMKGKALFSKPAVTA